MKAPQTTVKDHILYLQEYLSEFKIYYPIRYGGKMIKSPALFLSLTKTWKEKYEKKREMQIQVKCSCGGEGNCQEWAIVEVQGVVEVQPSFKDQIQNLEIGRLCRSSSSQENYTFTIGYHELSGSKISLKKPLLVMRKKKFMVENSDEHNKINPNSLRVELEVIGIIRHKILFKTRPKALISRPQSQVKEKKKVGTPSPSIQ